MRRAAAALCALFLVLAVGSLFFPLRQSLTFDEASGKVVIAANRLVGVSNGPDRFRALRERQQPIAHIAYSIWCSRSHPTCCLS